MSRYRYEIADNEGFAIRVWDDENPNENNAPFLHQPSWPDNTAWTSRQEAETWAQQFVAMKEDFRSGRPGENPANPFYPWTAEDEADYQESLLKKHQTEE